MYNEVGIYGGTFSPPHKGHIKAANEFVKQVSFDKLLIIPTNVPPHKDYLALASSNQRLDMCKLAFSSIPNCEVSDLEIKREGKSFTYETILELKQKYSKIHMLIGTDMFLTLSKWVHPEIIFGNAELYCFRREDEIQDEVLEEKNNEYDSMFHKRVHFLKGKPIEISSTEIREEVQFGGDSDLLSRDVLSYIHENHLYEKTPNFEYLRETVKSLVDEKRFIHTLGVEKMAETLGKVLLPREINDLRIAALCHDLTKCLSNEEQIYLLRSHNILTNEDEQFAPQVLHGWTAPLYMMDHLNEFYSRKIGNAIHSHTTGEAEMPLFSKIIFLADFIEEGRTYPNCIATRNQVLEYIKQGTLDQNLDRVLFEVVTGTIKHLQQKNVYIAKDTISTMRWLETKV